MAATPRRPMARPVVHNTSSGGGGGFVTVLILAAAIGGGAWYFMREPKKPVAENKPAPVVQAPKPVILEKPAPPPLPEIKAPEPVAPAPAPIVSTPPPVAPQPTPEPAFDISIFKDLLPLDGVASQSKGNLERAANLLRVALEKNQWQPYMDLLKRSMEKELSKTPDFDTPQRYDRYTGSPDFMRAMLQFALGKVADSETRALIERSDLVRQHVIWLCESPESLASFLPILSSKTNVSSVLDTWARIAADDSEALGTYRNLAIACSLVYPKPTEFSWNGTPVSVSADQRYRWYKAKDKAGKLATHITHETAWELAWVVGVPVPESEMEWTLTELAHKLHQKDWGNAIGMVPYDMEKAVKGTMKKPYDIYSFEEIRKKGGICMDQAYFASNTARCAGIPAVYVSGDGPRGPHAWIAWLSDDDHWSFANRFDGYPAGSVTDPTTGERISEQRFTRLSDHHAPSKAVLAKAEQLVWMSDLHGSLGQKDAVANALDCAMKVSPHQAELWEKKLDYWTQLQPTPDVAKWKAFLDALKREFRDDTEILNEARKAEDKFVLARASTDMVKNELRGDIRDLSKLKGLTSLEEIRSAHQRLAELFLKSKDYQGVRHVYKGGLEDYGRESSKFKALAKDYWNVVQSADSTVQQAACRDIENTFQRYIETRTGDYFDVESQISAEQVVADTWRKAGDIAKADRLEKEIEKRGKKAKKDAL